MSLFSKSDWQGTGEHTRLPAGGGLLPEGPAGTTDQHSTTPRPREALLEAWAFQ